MNYKRTADALITVVKSLLIVIAGLLLVIGYLAHIAWPVLW